MRESHSITPRDLEIAKEFIRRLAERVDRQTFEVTLYGSRARGDAEEESDLDLFVTLKRDDPGGQIKAIARHIACDLTLEFGILVSPFVADWEYLRRHQGYALLEAVEEEGVLL